MMDAILEACFDNERVLTTPLDASDPDWSRLLP